jgi:S1-C subfamily serine protease
LRENWGEWIKVLSGKGSRRQVMAVARTVAGTPAAAALQAADLLLAVDGKPVGDFLDVEAASRKDALHLTVLRNGHEIEVELATTPVSGSDIDRVVLWSGAALQAPHRALAAQRGIVSDGVLVAFFNYGSPSSRYGLMGGVRILEVDGKATPDLNTFLSAVQGRPTGASVRLKVRYWNDQTEVITVKPDLGYWPTVDYRRTDGGWVRKVVE